ncbi:2'-5' RNA ligase family protein [Salana multivorans]
MTEHGARQHLAIYLDGEAARAVDELRLVWDPVMRRVAPAHVTVVYPEETVDAGLLLERAALLARETSAFPIRLGEASSARTRAAAGCSRGSRTRPDSWRS